MRSRIIFRRLFDMNRRFFYVLSAALSVLSCSVKENRMECPCLLDIALSGGNDSRTVVGIWSEELVSSCNINSYNGTGRHRINIPRGYFTMSAYCGLKHNLPGSGDLLLEKGEEMDELYAGSVQLEALADTVLGSVAMHRQFAFINVRILCLSSAQMPQNITVKGNTAGVDLKTLKPIKGEYEVTLHPIFGEFCRASVPRQTDDSLTMDLAGIGLIPIGEYIKDSGFDWTARDLSDIELVIDYIQSRVTICLAESGEGRTFEFTI